MHSNTITPLDSCVRAGLGDLLGHPTRYGLVRAGGKEVISSPILRLARKELPDAWSDLHVLSSCFAARSVPVGRAREKIGKV